MNARWLMALAIAALPSTVYAQQDVDTDGDGFTPLSGDCNDSDDTIYPGAPELCDGEDNDCNNVVDDPADGDGDGFDACHGDCDDADANRHPNATEICNGVDDDCDVHVDERNAAGAPLTRACYSGPPATDGVGLCSPGTQTCTNGSWPAACAGEVTPQAETCDGQDDDCDGSTDEGFDADGDGVTTCAGDCDDADANRHPNHAEVCDGQDNDCDAFVDERNGAGDPIQRSCYGGPPATRNVGLCSDGIELCNGPGGWSGVCGGDVRPSAEQCDAADHDCDGNAYNGLSDVDGDGSPDCVDCRPNDANSYPGAPEVCDGVDNDCDTLTDERNGAGDPLRRSCYAGPPGTANVGLCASGWEVCAGGAFGACAGEVLPAAEQCDGDDNDCDGAADEGFDLDGDGVTTCAGDCDDADPANYPGNAEICDGQDNDCDMVVDENYDLDGDGVTTCAGDCNDDDDTIYPGAPEACNGVDDDCDGEVDEGFPDADMDGYPICGPSADCDDANAAIHPGANEVCDGVDNDCDALTDERNNSGAPLRRSCYSGPSGTNGVGECRSGRVECLGGTFSGNPCNNETVPRTEICDGRDDDCDGVTDEDFDADGDGFVTCGPNADCRDDDPNVHPGRAEDCDGLDNDCDGATDEDLSGQPLTRACYGGPANTEGVGICAGGTQACLGAAGYAVPCTGESVPVNDVCNGLDDDCDGEIDETFDADGDGHTSCGGDCDDANPDVHPGALELCNAVDDDCDGTIDGERTACYEGPVGTATVGECRAGTAICAAGMPAGMCDGQVLPVLEVCDGLDNDCDGTIDEDFDADGDGVTSCGGDCDDTSMFVAPGLAERCDCTDNDCDGDVDEDGFGGSICELGACHDFDGDGFTNCDADCNDMDASAYPGAPELCPDGVDNDCDGVVDEDLDEDGDGVTTCAGDCDDRFASIRPGAAEVCDAFDNDCDGDVDEGFDEDGDFATVCGGDCNDSDRTMSPFLAEICGNGIDDDCDGVVDPDDDHDGDGVTVCQGDCNDHNAAVYPGAPEVCDGHDNDCNRRTDEGFDEDGDTFSVCFGDCNDQDPTVHPFAREVVDMLDNDCDGDVDEGRDDLDGDGFSYMCGDCNDDRATVSPHAIDVCDGIDNDCDGRVDLDPQGRTTCRQCNDVDGDGVTDCEGDCADDDPAVHPGVTEVCDGVDNDCDGTVDLHGVFGTNLCTEVDAGTGGPYDAGTATTTPGPMASADGGVTEPGPIETKQQALTFGCGCHTARSEPFAPRWLGLLLLLGLFALRRPRRAALALLVLAGCTSIDAPPPAEAPPPPGMDAGTIDTGVVTPSVRDAGPSMLGPCDLVDPDRVGFVELPESDLQMALPSDFEVRPTTGVDAFVLDDDRGRAFAFVATVPVDPALDATAPTAASELIDRFVDPLFERGVPGVVGVASRVDENLRQTFFAAPGPAARSLRRVTMVNDVLASRVRNGVLAELGREPLGAIGGLADVADEVPLRSLQVAIFAAVSPARGSATIVVGVAPADDERASTAFADLTNGTHLGAPGASVELVCEMLEAKTLAVDFLWVVDNSASMREEQQALAAASERFFALLGETRIDHRVGVVTTDGEALRGAGFTRDVGAFRDAVQVGINGNGREAGLEFAVRAIERAKTATRAEERLRDGATPVVVFFTDEDATNLRSTETYVEMLETHGVLAYGILGPRPHGCVSVGRGAARVGERYIDVIEALGGTTASICADDLSAPIREILIAAAGAASKSRLERTPISGSIEVSVDGHLVPRTRTDGFDYEPTANGVLFFSGATLPAGAPYTVRYLRYLDVGI